MKKHDLPYMPFYFGDWRKCPEVQALDFETRMIWFEMLGFMWESTERGYLTLNEKPIPEEALARMIRVSEERLRVGLTLMDGLRVFSRRKSDNAIFCRRIVRDEERRNKSKEYGATGGNPLLVGKNKVKGRVKGRVNSPLIYESDNETEDASEYRSLIKQLTDGNSLYEDDFNKIPVKARKLLPPITIEDGVVWITKKLCLV